MLTILKLHSWKQISDVENHIIVNTQMSSKYYIFEKKKEKKIHIAFKGSDEITFQNNLWREKAYINMPSTEGWTFSLK